MPSCGANATAAALAIGFPDYQTVMTAYTRNSLWTDVPTALHPQYFPPPAPPGSPPPPPGPASLLRAAGMPVVMPTLECVVQVEDTYEGRRFVANPYFFMVDTAGNQLPYLDRWEEYYALSASAAQQDTLMSNGITMAWQNVDFANEARYEAFLAAGAPMLKAAIDGGGAAASDVQHPPSDPTARLLREQELPHRRRQGYRPGEAGQRCVQGSREHHLSDVLLTAHTPAHTRHAHKEGLLRLAGAKALLDGILTDRNGDGFRDYDDGSDFTINFLHSQQFAADAEVASWTADLAAVGLRLNVIPTDSETARQANWAGTHDLHGCSCGDDWAEIASNKGAWTPPYDCGGFAPQFGIEWALKLNGTDTSLPDPPAWVMEVMALGEATSKLPTNDPAAHANANKFAEYMAEERLAIGTVVKQRMQLYNKKLRNFDAAREMAWAFGGRHPMTVPQMYLDQSCDWKGHIFPTHTSS